MQFEDGGAKLTSAGSALRAASKNLSEPLTLLLYPMKLLATAMAAGLIIQLMNLTASALFLAVFGTAKLSFQKVKPSFG